MIEPYQWLLDNAETLGYNRDNVGPASVDLCLGIVKGKLVRGTYENVIFDPGIFYLCSTLEYIKMPTTHCGMINMRSSLARKGLGHKMAGFIDPGFEGQITLELETALPLQVAYGERIVQLIYIRLSETTDHPYTGRYNGQRGPTEAYHV